MSLEMQTGSSDYLTVLPPPLAALAGAIKPGMVSSICMPPLFHADSEVYYQVDSRR